MPSRYPTARTVARKFLAALSTLVACFMALFTYAMWWCADSPDAAPDGAVLSFLMVVLCGLVTLAYVLVAVHLGTTPPPNDGRARFLQN